LFLGDDSTTRIVNKISDEGVNTLFQKDSCNMVKGAMVLMKGVRIGNLYNLLVNVNFTRCNNIVAPEIDSTTTRCRHKSS